MLSCGATTSYLSQKPLRELDKLKADVNAGTVHPKEAKAALAIEIITRFHDAQSAARARDNWEAQFSRREVPNDMPIFTVTIDGETVWLPKALSQTGQIKSNTEARRRIEQGAIQIDGQKVSDKDTQLGPGDVYG